VESKPSWSLRCPLCGSKKVVTSLIDERVSLPKNKLFHCQECKNHFSIHKFDEIGGLIGNLIFFSSLAKKTGHDMILWR
jgi:hypothetical protein